MKKYIQISLLFFTLLLDACSSGNRIPKTAADKDLLSVLKKLDKDPSNSVLQQRVTELYQAAAKSHLDKIDIYYTLTETDRWLKIIKEYEALKNLSETINNSAAAKTVNAPTYIAEWQLAKQNGAQAYYDLGVSTADLGDKTSARNAYYAFKKANELVPGYKDVRQQMNIAYTNSIIKVVIYPVRDNTFFYNNMGGNNYGNNYDNDYFQRSLVSDLGGSYNKTAPALFYSDWEARRENVQPDWEVNLTWQYLNIPQPLTNQYARTISRQIEAGTDTSGKTRYQTVSATLNIIKKYFTASGDMELRITDVTTGKTITTNRYSEQFNWQTEYATYSGDSRALSSNEYALLNNNNYRVPQEQEILSELSRRIYPNIKNRIASVTNW